MEAIETFHEGVGTGTLKCVAGHNHYVYRKKTKQLVENRCQRCNEIETWEHVMLCEEIETMKEKYIKAFEEKLKKVHQIEHLGNQIAWMIGEIKNI